MTKPTLKAIDSGSDPIEPKKASAPDDATDFASLWLDPELGDGITNTSYHTVPVGKPKDFFRTVPDPAYRRRTEIYTHKPEGAIDEQHYIIAPTMRGLIDEAQPCTLVTVVYRDGSPRIWPVKLPKDGARDNEAWSTARSCAKAGLDKEKLREAISSGTFDTINGPIKFKGVENVITPTAFLQIQNGALELVWPTSIKTSDFRPKKGW